MIRGCAICVGENLRMQGTDWNYRIPSEVWLIVQLNARIDFYDFRMDFNF